MGWIEEKQENEGKEGNEGENERNKTPWDKKQEKKKKKLAEGPPVVSCNTCKDTKNLMSSWSGRARSSAHRHQSISAQRRRDLFAFKRPSFKRMVHLRNKGWKPRCFFN